MKETKKLWNDLLELKKWIREERGAIAQGKGLFKKIHTEKQLLNLIYEFNKIKNKSLNIIWFNGKLEKQDRCVISTSKVILTNGDESIVEEVMGISEEKSKDISFALGKSFTYGKRIWLQKLLDLSSDDIDPEMEGQQITKKINTNVLDFSKE